MDINNINTTMHNLNDPVLTSYIGFEFNRLAYSRIKQGYQLPLPWPLNFILNSVLITLKALAIVVLVMTRIVSIALMIELPQFLQFLSFDSICAYINLYNSVRILTESIEISGAQDISYEHFMNTLIVVLTMLGYLIIAAIYRTRFINTNTAKLCSVWEGPARARHISSVCTGCSVALLPSSGVDFATDSLRILKLPGCVYGCLPMLPLLYAPYVMIFASLHVLIHISDVLQYALDPQSFHNEIPPAYSVNHANNNIDPTIELSEIVINEATVQDNLGTYQSIAEQPGYQSHEQELPLQLELHHSLDGNVRGYTYTEV
jgi:hypothetical protein